MNQQNLEDYIKGVEGYSNTVYSDTLGNPTVGIGHMDRTMHIGDYYTDDQIDILFDQDITNAMKIIHALYPNFDQIDENRQIVLISLAFNMGNRLEEFHNTNRAINSGDWNTVAGNLQQSLWYTQVGTRGPKTCDELLTGIL